jgi:hypothetical protein
MSNFNYIDANTIQFPINEAGFVDVITFKKDSNLMPGTVRIDSQSGFSSQPSKTLFYNVDNYQKIVAINSTFMSIYSQYIFTGKFHDTDQSYGNWCNYNSNDKNYYLRFSYVFDIVEDYSSIPACSYYTSPISEFTSEEYQYANRSNSNTCSHPTMVENNPNQICHCLYKDSIKGFSICPIYKEDSKIYSVYKLTSKYSESNTFNISSKVYRDNDGIKLVASIYQTLPDETQVEIHNISIDTLSGLSNSDYLLNLSNLMDEVLEAYTETHNVEIIQNNEQTSSVTITKKSYIASLV